MMNSVWLFVSSLRWFVVDMTQVCGCTSVNIPHCVIASGNCLFTRKWRFFEWSQCVNIHLVVYAIQPTDQHRLHCMKGVEGHCCMNMSMMVRQ